MIRQLRKSRLSDRIIWPSSCTVIFGPEVQPCKYLVLETEELFTGKIKTMIDRHHSRDLYDLFGFTKTKPSYNADTMRKLVAFFASIMDRHFPHQMDPLEGISARDLGGFPILCQESTIVLLAQGGNPSSRQLNHPCSGEA